MRHLMHCLPEELLSPEEEEVLVNLGDETALKKLVMHTMRPAFAYLLAVVNNKLEEGEIFSICYKALMRATVNFKPKKQRFLSYSKPFLRGEFYRKWKEARVVHLPDEVSRRKVLRGPKEDELPPVSLAEALDNVEAVDPSFQSIDLKEKWALVEPLLGRLTKREREVIDLHFLKGFTLEQIAKEAKVTRKATSLTQLSALRKIRTALLYRKQLYLK